MRIHNLMQMFSKPFEMAIQIALLLNPLKLHTLSGGSFVKRFG